MASCAALASATNPNIVQIAAVATPFGGTDVAKLGRLFGIPSSEDMMPGSRFLQMLHRDCLPRLIELNMLATVGFSGDRVVPWPSSRVNGARNYLCGDTGSYAWARAEFPDTRHIEPAGVLRPGIFEWGLHMAGLFEHVYGLALLEPQLRDLITTFWEHAVATAGGPAVAALSPTFDRLTIGRADCRRLLAY